MCLSWNARASAVPCGQDMAVGGSLLFWGLLEVGLDSELYRHNTCAISECEWVYGTVGWGGGGWFALSAPLICSESDRLLTLAQLCTQPNCRGSWYASSFSDCQAAEFSAWMLESTCKAGLLRMPQRKRCSDKSSPFFFLNVCLHNAKKGPLGTWRCFILPGASLTRYWLAFRWLVIGSGKKCPCPAGKKPAA